MAKRQQTTGRPRRDRGQSDVPQNPSFFDSLLGNPKNREEYQIALSKFINNIMRGFVALLVLALAVYLVYEFLWVPNQTVATVNGQNITVSQFRERIAFERGIVVQQYSSTLQQIQQQAAMFGMDVESYLQQDTQTRTQLEEWKREIDFPDTLGDRVLDEMIDDLLVQQEFSSRGLSLDTDSTNYARLGVDSTQFAMIGTPATETPTPTVTPTALVSPTPSPTPLPTNTPTLTPSPTVNPELTAEATGEATAEVTAEVTEQPTLPPSPTPSREDLIGNREESATIFEDSMKELEVSQNAIDDYYRRQANRSLLSYAMWPDITTTSYVNVRHILVETEEEATQIIASLNAGESFALLAQSHSLDTGSGQRGGELGWAPAAFYVGPFGTAVETAEIGVTLAPVQTEFGWHVIQVRGREDRAVDPATASRVRQGLFTRWLTTTREAADAAGTISINDNWANFLPQS